MAALRTFAIYDRPRDYPNHFVVRGWEIVVGVPVPVPDFEAVLAVTLDEARAAVPAGLVNLGRSAGDDPAIVEVWV